MKFFPRLPPHLNLRISLTIVILMALSFTALHWWVMTYLEKFNFSKLDTQLTTHLANIEHQLHSRQNEIAYLAQTLSTELSLKRALVRNSSRGVSQALNRTIEIYPFFRYALLSDDNQEVFTSSTRNNQGEKIAGENTLGLSIKKVKQLSTLLKKNNSVSLPLLDPFSTLFEIEERKVQWYASPVKQRKDIIGWLVLCYNWKKEVDDILTDSMTQLHNTGTSVTDISLWQAGNKLASATKNDATQSDLDSVTKQQSFTIVDTYELSISVDRQQTIDQIQTISRTLTLFFGIAGIVIFALLFIGTDIFIIRRISQINQGAEVIRSGNLNHRIPDLGRDEIGLLANAFNAMSSSLSELWSNLEEKVRTRTQELHQSNRALEKRTQLLLTSEEQLKKQHKDLQDSNQQLEEQQQQLRKSEIKLKQHSEELQVTNAQLSENHDKLERQTLKLRAANVSIELKAKQLEEASKYKSEFIANMSHELRTPLNSLLILSKSLVNNETGNLTDSQVEDAKYIHEGGEELLDLINDIMDLSKVEAGMLSIYSENVFISDLAKAAKNRFTPMANEKNINLLVEIADSAPQCVKSDGKRIEQILKNFLANSLKFTTRGEIKLRIFTPDKDTRLTRKSLKQGNILAFSVTDSGIGIAKDKQALIFEAFQQEDGSISRKYGGTGLGLTIARQLTALLDGEITLSSTLNVGSTFTLYLPALLQQTEQETPHLETPSAHTDKETNILSLPVDNSAPHTRSLLIIEDDKKSRISFQRIAEKNGYLCLVANTGTEGITKAIHSIPDGILLDIGLPDISGLTVLEQLKENPLTKDIPVHIISALDLKEVSINKGALSYLRKPVDMSDIEFMLQSLNTNNTRKKILVIEDNKTEQRVISRILSSNTHDLSYAQTGQQATTQLKSTSFDGIILDLGLPDIDGIDLARQIKTDTTTSNTPIIIYTARDLSEEQYQTLVTLSNAIIIKGKESDERLLDDIALFLHHVDKNQPAADAPTTTSDDKHRTSLQDQRALLVDDDMRNAFALSKQLTAAGMNITIADSGKTALNKLENQDYDIILMDIMMPIMDGYEATRKIRQIDRFKNIPIIALTANAMPEDREKCIAAGASEYMTKPIDIDQLMTMLKIWLYGSS